MQFKTLLYAATLIVITALACQKEVSLTNIPGTGTNNATTITATITGRISNENGAPVQGAVVKAGNSSTQTNINGEFRLNNATVVDKAALVTVEKSGYFTGSRTFIAKAGQKHYVEIELLPSPTVATINATTGGLITLANGSAISMPANSVVVKSTGATYTGTVQVAMAWIDPTSNKLMRQMPGDLRGIDEANTEVGLQSFGMLGVELTSPTGEKLQIATGKTATLTFPLPSAIIGSAPATVALWSFNETTGLWKQEGTATKTGSTYIAQVSHFSFWNCDAPFPQVVFSATFTNQTGQPLRHVLVRIKRTVNTSYTQGWTDTAGYVSGIVPKNEPLILEVYATSNCNQVLYTQNIGPFSANTNIGTIAITLSGVSTFSVTGSVLNCNGLPLAAGYIDVNLGSFIAYRAPVANGSFSLTFPGCAATQSITYYAVDSAGGQQSAPVTATINAGNNSLATITACGISTQRFINFTINGVAYAITSPPDSTTGRTIQGSTLTQISGFKVGNSTPNTSINFSLAGALIGAAPVSNVYIQAPTLTDSAIAVVPLAGSITEYGPVGSYIAGSFSGNLNGSGTTIHTVQCTFRVRRNN